MSDNDICRIFRDIALDVANVLVKLHHEDKYHAIVGKGPSGDVSRLIDIYSEDMIVEKTWSTGLRAWVISEESGIRKNTDLPEYIVLVDPLDGSLNYAHGVEYASISISVYKPGASITKPIYGIVKSIFTDSYFEICNGKVYHNGVEVVNYRLNEDGIISIYTENPMDIQVIKEAYTARGIDLKIRTMGSASLESALASLGYISGFIHTTGKLRNLDIAVSLSIAERLGVRVLTEPTVDRLSILDIQLVKKAIIASPRSILWSVVDKLGRIE